MQQIADWLAKLGLPEYAEHFSENGVDVSVLPHLTDQDLKDMGVLLGHRRKMLAAIRELAAAVPVPPAAATEAEPKTRDLAERRQVTVMFSDLVGSTALSARMDPEDLREVISAYQNCVAETVRRFGGYVAKYLGDGVLVFFGYPKAHEDDAERAVQAALELSPALAGLKTRAALQGRVGIATGLVVVGDLVGSSEAQERSIIGETPNLAARLQGIAQPNMIVISDSTRRMLGNLFEIEELATRELKGIPERVRAWAVLRARSVESRFEALHVSGLTGLVGREEESDLLLRRWGRAKAGEGQVVLLSGEAGIGKSRLTAALLERIGHEPHTRVRHFCSPLHTDSALHPIISQMERAAGFAYDDTGQAKADKLEAMLAGTSTTRQDMALIAETLSIANDGRYPTLELSPHQRRQRTLEALVTQVAHLAAKQPVLMIFEDVHWIDPTSLEVLDRIVDLIAILPILLIVTFRPEFEPPWVGQPLVTALTLNRLTRREVDVMIDRVVGRLVPASTRQEIVQRSDGIPLFVEEMTKAVLEAESEGAARRTTASAQFPAVAVPESLRASLVERLDRLGQAKEIAQIGAVIGREFSHALLVSVVGETGVEFDAMLDRLTESGLLFRRGVSPNAIYTFKHALVQDAAYETLLRSKRRALHERIGQLLEAQASCVDTQPELIAHHFSEAGVLAKAVSYWVRAGQLALARSANAEATSHLTKALVLVRESRDVQAREQQELEVLVTLGPALIATRGYAASETVTAYERARELLRVTGDRTRQDAVLTGVFVSYYNLAKFEQGLEVGREFLHWAEEVGDAVPLCIGHRMLAVSFNSLGRFAEARTHAEQALRFYDPALHSSLAWRYIHDLGVAAMCHRANAMWHLGFPEQAITIEREALAWAKKLNHHNTTGYALFFAGALPAFRRRDIVVLDRYAKQLVAHGEQHELPQWVVWGTYLQGPALTAAGRASEAITRIEKAIETAERMQNRAFRPMVHGILAEARFALGNREAAIQLIDDALTLAERTGEIWMKPELLRTKGSMLLSAPAEEEAAEECVRHSIKSAQQQGSKMFELRSSLTLARAWRDAGKMTEARELVSSIYNGLSEGFGAFELKEAEILLRELDEG